MVLLLRKSHILYYLVIKVTGAVVEGVLIDLYLLEIVFIDFILFIMSFISRIWD